MERSLQGDGYHPGDVFRIPSPDRWIDQEGEPSIEEMLRAYVGKYQNDWDDRLRMIEFAYNNSIHSSLGFAPFYLCYGHHPVSPVNLLSQVESKNEAANSFLHQLEADLAQTLENLNRTQEKQKKYADKKRRELEL